MDEVKARELGEKVFTDQAKRLEPGPGKPDISDRRTFMSLFTTSNLGLGIKHTGAGSRKSREQVKFRDALFEVAKQGPDPGMDEVWCPIASSLWPKSSIRAAHIFS